MASLNLVTKDGRPKERVLVTGATGFVASHCVDQLLREHYIVRGSVRDLSQTAKVGPIKALASGSNDRLELVEADLLLKDSWDQAVSGCDYVIHVASPVPAYEPKHADKVILPALDGTLAVLEACRRAGYVKKVVVTGTALNVYDALVGAEDDVRNNNETHMVHTEDEWTALDDGSKHNVFVQSKVRAEKAAWNFMEILDAVNSADASIKEQTTTASAAALVVPPAADACIFRPHSNSINRLLNKQSRHKASASSRYPGSFTLTTILPCFIVGPCIHGQNTIASQLIHAMLLGGAEMPVIPDLGIEICDVRDVARAHVKTLKCRESDGHRILIFSSGMWLRDAALALSREFSVLGYRVPTKKAPRWFGRVYTYLRRDLSWMRRKPHRITFYSNEKMQHLLGITPISAQQSLIDMAHSLIMHEEIRMTPMYRQWLTKTELAACKLEKQKQKREESLRQHADTTTSQTLKKAADELKKNGRPSADADANKASTHGNVDLSSSTGSSSSSSSLGLLMNSRRNRSADTFSIASDNDNVTDKDKTLTTQGSLLKRKMHHGSGDALRQAAESVIMNNVDTLRGGRCDIGGTNAVVACNNDDAGDYISFSRTHDRLVKNADELLKAAADDDDAGAAGRMLSHHNIESDDSDDEFEDAAEDAMLAADEAAMYRY